MRTVTGLLAALCAGSILLAAPAHAEPPAVKLISAPGVSPSAAWTYYNGLGGTAHTNGVAAWKCLPPAQSLPQGVAPCPPEISALARTLGAERISQATPLPAGKITP